MNRKTILLCGFLLTALVGGAQELKMTGSAPLTQVFGESVESDEPLPMNDLGIEFGYVLYEAEVTLPGGDAELELANVRDYAAVYLDGGIGQARKLIHDLVLTDEKEKTAAGRDFKTALQELVQRESGQVLAYRLTGESGPDHAKTFCMEVQLNGKTIGAGQGRSKKEAEQAAAKAAVASLEQDKA